MVITDDTANINLGFDSAKLCVGVLVPPCSLNGKGALIGRFLIEQFLYLSGANVLKSSSLTVVIAFSSFSRSVGAAASSGSN